jgi:peptide/nickel transport system permease protein
MTTLAPQRFKLSAPRSVPRPVLPPLLRVVVRRLLLAVPLLFVVSVLSFVLVSLTPGDVARQILGQDAPQSAVLSLRHQLGIDQPIYEQYWHWLTHAISGDFGTSVFTGQAVSEAINARIGATLWLILLSLLVVGVLGVGLGVLSAVRGGVVARVVDAFSLIGFALPSFWIGAVLISLLAVRNHWFPAVGYVSPADSPGRWLQSLTLPIVALSLHSVAALAKQTREAMVDVLGSEHIRMARANGVSTASLLFRHALKNAAIRIVTIFGLLTVGLLGGTVIVESVFALPGTGSLAVTAVTQHDLPVAQGIVIYYTLIVVVVNLLVDLAYTWLNPRVRTR